MWLVAFCLGFLVVRGHKRREMYDGPGRRLILEILWQPVMRVRMDMQMANTDNHCGPFLPILDRPGPSRMKAYMVFGECSYMVAVRLFFFQ